MRGCVVILLDESAEMRAPISKQSKKCKAESVATAVNALLARLSRKADFDLALVGYRSQEDGAANVGIRWSGALAGREFVPSAEVAASPATVERRVRKAAGAADQAVDFPIWYQPTVAGKACQVAAFEHCRRLICDWAAALGADAGQPLVMHVFTRASSDGNPLRAVQELQQMALPNGAPLVLQAHLVPSEDMEAPVSLYPANRAYLSGSAKDLFERASILPDTLKQALAKMSIRAMPQARGMIYNARLVDLAQLLFLAETYAEHLPPATVPAPTQPFAVSASEPIATQDVMPVVTSDVVDATQATSTIPEPIQVADASPLPQPMPDLDIPSEAGPVPPAAEEADPERSAGASPALVALSADQPGLVLFVLDRSVADPYAAEARTACSRLQERMSEIVEMITKFGHGAIDVGVISYGSDSSGVAEVRAALEGGLAGRAYARDSELLTGALRVDAFNEEMSDGAGEIMRIPHNRPILVEVEPTLAAPAAPAFVKVAEVLSAWRQEHPINPNSPVVVHLTRGQLDLADAEEGIRQIQPAAIGCPVAVYHVVETETNQPSLCCPAAEAEVPEPKMQALWRLSTALLGREQLAVEKPTISEQSRGFIVNGCCNVLLEAVKRAIAC